MELTVWFVRVQPVHAVVIDANVRWDFCSGAIRQLDRELRVDVIRRIMTAEVARDRTDVLAKSTDGICNGYAVLVRPRACGDQERGGEDSNKLLLHALMITICEAAPQRSYATLTTAIQRTPATRSARAASRAVAPLVWMSSTSTTALGSSVSSLHDMAPCMIDARAERVAP